MDDATARQRIGRLHNQIKKLEDTNRRLNRRNQVLESRLAHREIGLLNHHIDERTRDYRRICEKQNYRLEQAAYQNADKDAQINALQDTIMMCSGARGFPERRLL
ncbi:MAG: hypothetical protein ACOC7M_02405 [Chloroflexota bacterium]